MAIKSDGNGFGTNPPVLIQSGFGPNDALIREVRGGDKRVDLKSVVPEIDAGAFIRAASDATVNGGAIVVGRLGIFVGKPGLTLAQLAQLAPRETGALPIGWLQEQLRGFDFRWQTIWYAYPNKPVPDKWTDGEMSIIGDQSFYIVFGGLVLIQAGTVAAPGNSIACPDILVDMSVSGVDYNIGSPLQTRRPGEQSMPRFDFPGLEP